jgi:hypothetical protein
VWKHDNMTDNRAIMAARNNADWYAMMFNVHGLKYQRSEIAFLALEPPPAFHSWMTTLDPDSEIALRELISQCVDRPCFGLKDSFHCLELAPQGLVMLFSATWIWTDAVQAADTNGWHQITSVSELLSWERAWKVGGSPSDRRQFPDPILERSDVVIWGRRGNDGFDAGVIANISSDCVGLSNCFGEEVYPAAATLCAELANGLPIVGYERGDDLGAALGSGFTATGLLRVWTRPAN